MFVSFFNLLTRSICRNFIEEVNSMAASRPVFGDPTCHAKS